jgi:hypothetical protein
MCARREYAQLRTVLVDPRDEQCDAERARHHRVIVVDALAEAERKVADRLRRALDADPLVVRERVVLRGHARVVDHRARVRGEARHCAAEVRVDLHDLLDRRVHEQRRLHALLDAEHDALRRPHADGRRAELRAEMRAFGGGADMTAP